jgi:hypothetical protein
VLGLAAQVAMASSEAAATIERAGLLGSFMSELRDPSDALACAASLEVMSPSPPSPNVKSSDVEYGIDVKGGTERVVADLKCTYAIQKI